MLNNCKNAKERWGGVSHIIDRWLEDRQQMLVQYCALSALQAGAAEDLVRGEKLREFCQGLVDYVSAGHFEVYDQLIKEGREFDDEEALQQAGKLYSIIDRTTSCCSTLTTNTWKPTTSPALPPIYPSWGNR